jgi:uncharacterized OsmC-like protein
MHANMPGWRLARRLCTECAEPERSSGARIDRFERVISVDGELSEQLRAKIAEIAAKCPVHGTLEAVAKVATVVKSDSAPT